MSSMPSPKVQDYAAAVASGTKDVPWYQADLGDGDFSPACRELLETYSKIEPDRVNAHVLEIRERAWSIFPYPCIGQFRFLGLSISVHPSYQRILSFLKEPETQHTLLDLGCCFAQGIRKLVYDGVPSENLYACDLQAEFPELGYELFKDRDTLRTHCFAADVFQPGGDLELIEGKIDVIYAANFFHLFSWDDQIEVAKRVIRVLKPQMGSLVFGRQVGNIKAREMESKSKPNGVKDTAGVWTHDTDSFRKLWEIAGNETGTRWKTWVELDEGVGMNSRNWAGDGLRRLRYEVERLE